jgi:hypothetical protein
LSEGLNRETEKMLVTPMILSKYDFEFLKGQVYTLVIPATKEAEIRKIIAQGHPRQKS